jgi:hypothetical protein
MMLQRTVNLPQPLNCRSQLFENRGQVNESLGADSSRIAGQKSVREPDKVR